MAYPTFNPYARNRHAYRDYGYGRQEEDMPSLSEIAQIILQRQRERENPQVSEVPSEEEISQMYQFGAPAPEGLSPLGRFTDMGLRDRARGGAAASLAKEKMALKEIMEGIRRTTTPTGMQTTFPSGATITQERPMAPSILDSPYATPGAVAGSATFGTRTQESTIGGMPSSEWFQRSANAAGANKFASPEPGYQGIPFSAPGTENYSSWEKATAKFRQPKKK